MKPRIGDRVRLLELPDGCSARDYPLTVGAVYLVVGLDGSTVVTTSDESEITARYHRGRVEVVTPRLRVYLHPNGDGRYSFLVAAKNQAEACRLIGTSVSDFRKFGGRALEPDHPAVAVAMSEPGRVWKQKIMSRFPEPWVHAYPEPTP